MLRRMLRKPIGGCVRPDRAIIAPTFPNGAFGFVTIYNQLIFASGATITGLSTLILGTVTASTVIAALLQAVSAQIGELIAQDIVTNTFNAVSAYVTGSVNARTLEISNSQNLLGGPVIQSISATKPYTGNIFQIGSTFSLTTGRDGNLFANPEPIGMAVSYNFANFGYATGGPFKWCDTTFPYIQTYGRLNVGTFVNGVFTATYAGLYHFNPVFCCLNPTVTQFDILYFTTAIPDSRYLGSVTRVNNLLNTQTPFVTYLAAGDSCTIQLYVTIAQANFQGGTVAAGTVFRTSRLEIWRV